MYSWGEDSGLRRYACHLTYSWEGAGRGETVAFESFIPLYYVYLTQQHAQQPPLFFSVPLRSK